MKKQFIVIIAIIAIMTGCSNQNNDRNNSTSSKSTHSSTSITDESNVDNSEFEYVHNNDETGIVVILYNGNSTTVNFPNEIDGLPVVMIGSDPFATFDSILADVSFKNTIEEITLPDTITYLTEISDYTKLKKLTIPNEVESVNSIRNCPELTSLYFPDNAEIFGSFENDIELSECVLPKSMTIVNNSMFRNCSSITDIELPNQVTKIGQCAFFNCSSLTNINIPDSVGQIAPSAFVGCDNLVVNCNKGSYAEEFCVKYNIKTNIIGTATKNNKVTEIANEEFDNGEFCYYYCSENYDELCLSKYYGNSDDVNIVSSYYTDFTDDVKVTSIGKYFIEDDKNCNIHIPETVEQIDKYAFAYPDKVKIYGKSGSYAEKYAKENGIEFVSE